MILDSSVLIAIALREPNWQSLVARLESENLVGIGSPTLLESGIVLRARLNGDPEPFLQRFLRTFGVVEIEFGAAHRLEALDAFHRYGKGRHSAGLNFGDCMSYAVAKVVGRPLLFVGDDFGRTDIEIA